MLPGRDPALTNRVSTYGNFRNKPSRVTAMTAMVQVALEMSSWFLRNGKIDTSQVRLGLSGVVGSVTAALRAHV